MKHVADLYLAALQAYLAADAGTDMRAAHDLGTEAIACGLDTLELAKIHDQALLNILANRPLSAPAEDLTRRAELFFTETIIPVEGTHRLALEAAADLRQAASNLERRILDLADSKEVLQQEIAGRQEAEDSLIMSEDSSSRLLKDSLLLEAHLKETAHKVLSANEAERKKMSLLLNDEIVQTLLGINLRMLALKTEISANQTNHDLEIATTQRLVDDSSTMIRRLAHEFSTPLAR